MTAADAALVKRRKAYHDAVADAALAEQDAAETRRAEMEAAMEAERARREELSRRRENARTGRNEELSAAEKNCRAMIKHMARSQEFGEEEASLCVALGERPPPGLSGPSVKDSLSAKLSATLRQLADHGGRFGGMTLARSWRQPGEPWTTEGIARRGPTEQEKIDDQ